MTLDERIDILRGIGNDPLLQQEHKALCAQDVAFFINTALFICEPRGTTDLVDLPYLLRSFQEDYVRELSWHIDNDESLLTDKTREMGVTWMVEAVLLHRWLFNRGFVSIVSSITEDKIDKSDDPTCLFWKFDYMIESLKWTAPWLYPEDYVKTRPFRTHMKIFNPSMQSIINGEVMGPNLGRSGRAKCIFLDEFAEATNPSASWASSSRTSYCRIVVFTPKGNNFAGRLANPPKGIKATINKITLHWIIDETKNHYEIHEKGKGIIERGNGEAPQWALSDVRRFQVIYPWYEKAKAEVNYDPVKIAQELDVNYADSAEGLMYPQIRRARFGKFVFNPSFPLYLAMDYGVSDACTLVWAQYNHFLKRFVFIDGFSKNGRGILWYVPFILGPEYIYLGDKEGGYTPDEIAMIHDHAKFKGMYTAFYGDPSGKNRNLVTNTSVIQELAKFGIHTQCNHKMNNYEIRHKRTQSLILNSDFDEDRAAEIIDALENSKFKETETTFKPIHDEFSHFRTAVEYLAVNHRHGFNADTPTPESLLLAEINDSELSRETPKPEVVLREIIRPGQSVPTPAWVGEYNREDRQIVIHGPGKEFIGVGPQDILKQLAARERKQDEIQKRLDEARGRSKKGGYRRR